MFLGTFLASVFNYLFHLVAGRSLTIAEYGLLESFFAILYLLTVFTGAITLIATKFTGSVTAAKVGPRLFFLEQQLRRLTLLILLLAPLFWLGLRAFLHIYQPFFYLTLFSLTLLGFWTAVYNGVLSGRLKFTLLAMLAISQAGLKLLFVFLLLWLGWRLGGVFLGLFLAAFFPLMVMYFGVRRSWPPRPATNFHLGQFWSLALLALAYNFFAIILYNGDLLLVRHFFSAIPVGIYASASVVARMIFFGTTIILSVTYPLLVRYHRQPQRQRFIFAATFLLMVTLATVGVSLFSYRPAFWVAILYGRRYALASQLLPLFSLTMAELALLNLFAQFFLARQDYRGLYFLLLTFIAQISFIVLSHASLLAVVIDNLLSFSLGVILAVIMLYPMLTRKLRSGS